MEENLLFLKTSRGGKKIVYKGFIYAKHKRGRYSVFWRCVLRDKCSAILTTSSDEESARVIAEKEHSHAPDWASCKAAEVMEKIKERATTSMDSASRIVQSLTGSISNDTFARLPKEECMKKAVRRARQRELPEETISIEEMDHFPEKYTTTKDGDRWLLNGDIIKGVVIFATDWQLRIASRENYWICDCTFQVPTKIKNYLFCIYCKVRDLWVPVVLVLMTRKTKETFDIIFGMLKQKVYEKCGVLVEPGYISCDHEEAIVEAIRESFPTSQITGSFFHLARSLWSRLRTERLDLLYMEKKRVDVREDFHALLALAFIPVEDVSHVFDLIKSEVVEELQTVCGYIEENYVLGRQGSSPAFPPQVWNCYERKLAGMTRTTSTCEAWHNRLNKVVAAHHATFYHFMEQLQRVVSEIHSDIDDLESGHALTKKRRRYGDFDEKVERFVVRYCEYRERKKINQYLRCIGENFAGEF